MPIHGEPTLIEQVRNVVTTYKGTVGAGMSVADVTKIARVEPITLISSNLIATKELYNVLQGVLNIYAAYQMQAVSLLGTQIYDSRILRILDKTNPDRDLKTFLAAGQLVGESFSVESDSSIEPGSYRTMSLTGCKFGLPFVKSDKRDFSAESMSASKFGYNDEEYSNKQIPDLTASANKIDSFDKLGVTVGKVIEITFNVTNKDRKNDTKENTSKIPVLVKLDTMVIPGEAISDIATLNSDEITFGSRLSDAIRGRISFIKDFLLCVDLIKAQKKTMIKDTSGLYTQLLKRVNNSKLYSALSGNVSVAGVSAVIVMSELEENEIQKRIGGRLSNLKTREMVFNNISAMMIVVIDREWERVSIYIRDIDGYSQAPISSFKSGDKTADMTDMFKALSMSNAPSF